MIDSNSGSFVFLDIPSVNLENSSGRGEKKKNTPANNSPISLNVVVLDGSNEKTADIVLLWGKIAEAIPSLQEAKDYDGYNSEEAFLKESIKESAKSINESFPSTAEKNQQRIAALEKNGGNHLKRFIRQQCNSMQFKRISGQTLDGKPYVRFKRVDKTEGISYEIFDGRICALFSAPLGQGAYKKVKAAYIPLERKFIARSTVKNKLKEACFKEKIAREIRLQNTCEGPLFVRIFDACIQENKAIIHSEYCNFGSLEHPKGNCTAIEDLVLIFRDLFDALVLMQQNNIVHRDIKPDNILLHQEQASIHAKVTDFGLAVFHNDPPSNLAGTPLYFPPELAKSIDSPLKIKLSPKADLWSLGVVIYKTVFRKHLYEQLCGELKKPLTTRFNVTSFLANLEQPQIEDFLKTHKHSPTFDYKKKESFETKIITLLEDILIIETDHPEAKKRPDCIQIFWKFKDLFDVKESS